MQTKVVIGANYGDEGKGLMAQYFSRSEKTLGILYNGGSQRGHTVINGENRHVFHHFSSGTFEGADTYFTEDFILNPLVFEHEVLELGFCPQCYSARDIRITTPIDIAFNQAIERKRGKNRHGSCGYGILETIKRYEAGYGSVTLGKIYEEYVPIRMKELGFDEIPFEIKYALHDLRDYNRAFKYMANHIEFVDFKDLFKKYDNIVFEGGQGLLLDQHYIYKDVHLTPSNTGMTNVLKMLEKYPQLKEDLEICYVTRTYMTRHGAGNIDNQRMKWQINPKMKDLTNVPNEFQGILKYGIIDTKDLLERCKEDAHGYKWGLALTHCNEFNNEDLYNIASYLSTDETRIYKMK